MKIRPFGRRLNQRMIQKRNVNFTNNPIQPQQQAQPAQQPQQSQTPAAQPQPQQQPQAQPQQSNQQSQEKPQQSQQPQQNVFERRASGENPISNVINFANQNRSTSQQQAQMQAQQQQAQFLQSQQQAQQPQQTQQQPQQAQPARQAQQLQLQQVNRQLPKPANYFPNLQQKLQPQQQMTQQGLTQEEMPQEEMQQEDQMFEGGMPQMPKPSSFQQLQGLSGQAGALAGLGSQLAKFAGASGLAGKLGGAAGGLGAAAQGLGAFSSLAGGDKVGGVDQLAGMAANFIPGAGPVAGLAYNMIPEGLRKEVIGQGLNVAGKLGLDSNVFNVSKPGKVAEGLAKTGLNVVTGGKVGKQALKAVTKAVPKIKAPKIKAPKIKICHLAGTKIRMADGSIKNIENLKLGDQLALGGTLLSKGESFQTELLYNYNNVLVTGSHAVFEQGNWLRVEESELAYSVEAEGLLYPLVTENNLIVTEDGQVWADMNEVDDTYNLTDDDIIDKLNTDYERNKYLQEYMNDISPIISATRVRFA